MSQKLYRFTLHHQLYPAINPTNPSNSLSGKNVIITGAGAGIGLDISECFAQANVAHLMLIGRTASKLEAIRDDLQAKYKAKIHVVQVNLTSPTGCGARLAALSSELGRFDIMVLNASSLHQPADIADLNMADWWQSFETNVRGNMLMTQAFLENAKPKATVICITSLMSYLPTFPYRASGYAASKAAFETVLKHLHEERPDLRLFCLHPGTVKTDMMLKIGVPGDADDLIWYDDPMLAEGNSVWPCSDLADFLNGRTVEAMWDVKELEDIKPDILEDPTLFTLALNGRAPFSLTKK